MHVKITDLTTGKTIHHGYFARLEDVWFTVEPACREFYEADRADDISCGESEQHGDVIEINGKPVATIEHVYRRPELKMGRTAA